MSDAVVLPVETVAPKTRSVTARLLSNRSVVAGLILVGAVVAIAVLAPLLAPHDPYTQDLTRRLVPPIWHDKGTWANPLGTDNLGRDYLSRLLYGARISLLIGFSVMLISGLIGTSLGLVAGYFGGRVDLLISFLITARLAMPVVLVALAVVAMVGGSLPVVILTLGLLKWDRFAVVMRSATQQVRSLDYVAAAEAAGASRLRVLLGEILPNVFPHLIVVATVEAGSAILLEAALSFLGLGVQPPLPSWGLMIAEAKNFMFFSFWLIGIPGTALALLVLGINLLGDGLRDVFAPEGRA
ncbi:MAG: peptide ABC transporter permease [Proteobacteria bacterium]|jgi:ABC-type dipeptide/oligopeptide/nickel transport systems, permease components|nr:MAG: peptide ABC transporter permease [Pseudomonadota bacterium]